MKQIVLTLGGIVFFFLGVFPCEYNIRDAAFVNLGDLPYTLYFFVDDQTPAEIIEAFNEESRRVISGSNVLPRVIHVSRDRGHRALEHIRFWDIQDLPAFILVSPDLRTLPLHFPGGKSVNRDSIPKVLKEVVSSSAREEILIHIVKAYAVLVLIEGKDREANRLALEKLRQASRKIHSLMSQLPKRIESPPHILVFPWERTEGEELLLWSLDLYARDLERPTIVVLFGRGRLFYSPFESKAMSVSEITDMLTIIGLSCDCGLDKEGLIGQNFPLRWDESLQSEVVGYLGFDAENPLIKREIAGILAANNLDAASGEGLAGPFGELAQYRERALAFGRKMESSRISPVLAQRFSAQSSGKPRTGFNLLIPLLTAGFLLAAILAGAILIRMRAKRENP